MREQVDLTIEKRTLLNELAAHHVMVLATSANNIVTARNVSIVLYRDKLYFQTDSAMEKARQLRQNPLVALCIENIQIEGLAKEIGTWENHQDILKEYQKYHCVSYEKYKNLSTEEVIEIEITRAKKWEYREGKPYIYELNCKENFSTTKEYDINSYKRV